MLSLGTSPAMRDPSFDVKRCECGAQFVWTTTEKGRRMPVNLERSPTGTLLLYAEYLMGEVLPGYRVRTAAPSERLRLGGMLWTSHFATCPKGDGFRRRTA
jgi:hypothetical protein